MTPVTEVMTQRLLAMNRRSPPRARSTRRAQSKNVEDEEEKEDEDDGRALLGSWSQCPLKNVWAANERATQSGRGQSQLHDDKR